VNKIIWLLPLLFSTHYVRAQKKTDKKTIANLQMHVAYLASDKLEGRLAGSPGEKLAAVYISGQMKDMGLATLGEEGFLQTFTIKEGKEPAADTKMSIGEQILAPGTQFVPLPFSATKAAQGEVTPNVNEPDNIWLVDVAEMDAPNAQESRLHQYLKESLEAHKAGATAVVFYNSKETAAEVNKWLAESPTPAPIPAVWVNEAISKKLMADDAGEFKINLQVAFKQSKRTGTNVIGYIDNNAPKTIILGAHYDHLGRGEDGKGAGTNHEIYNGADDNASGTAALLEIARLLKTSKLRGNNYVIIAFSGEEQELMGSRYFIEHSKVDLSQANYMINMDMIGRLNADKGLQIGGTGTSPSWNKIIPTVAPKDLKVAYHSTGTGPSDHTSFYHKNIPVLFFCTGTHNDTRQPADDAGTLNYEGELAVVKLIFDIIDKANSMEKLVFTPAI
jgi:aminopeptidase YwaD